MSRSLLRTFDRNDQIPRPAASPEPVVEIGLFLTPARVSELRELSRKRGESVGQLIRSMIDRELAIAAEI